jgi:signal transduction histidine kinase
MALKAPPRLPERVRSELSEARARVAFLEECNRAVLESLTRIEALSAFQEQLEACRDAEQIGERLAQEIRSLLPVKACALFQVDPATHEFALRAVWPRTAAAAAGLEQRAQVECGVFAWVVNRRQPAIVPPLAFEREKERKGTLILVPVATAHRTHGMVLLLTGLDEAHIPQEAFRLLTLVARQAALAIENALLLGDLHRQHASLQRAHEALQASQAALREANQTLEQKVAERTERLAEAHREVLRRNRELQAVIAVAAAVSQSLDLEEILAVALERTLEVVGAPTGVVWLSEPGRPGLTLRAHRGLPPGLADREALDPPGDPAALNGAPLRVEQLAGSWTGAGFRTAALVPLRAKGSPVGLLGLLGAEAGLFAPADRSLLEAIGAQIGVAVANARLFAEREASLRLVRRTQAKALQSAKRASIGTLAAGVAHEINNPLCIIGNHVQILQLHQERLDPPTVRALGAIRQNVDRIGRIVHTFIDYARSGPAVMACREVNAFVDKMISLVERLRSYEGTRFAREFTPGLPPVAMDEAQLGQALVQLFENARDAMPGGGEIVVQTLRAPRAVRITVADRGAGIAPGDRDKVFDPFFTTKAVGRGVGLGLTICQGIVRDHGGDVTFETQVDHGTTFRIELPVAD